MSAADCVGVRELAGELALGVVTGAERAEAVAHLDSCAACRGLVAELADVADQILQLAPEAEAPAGFETRVLAAMRAPEGAGRRRRRAVVAAAAATGVAAGLLAGALVFRDRDSRIEREYTAALEALGGRALAAGTLEDDDRARAGQVFLYEGDVSWLFVTVDDPSASGDFTVELRRENGERILVPGLHLEGGKGSLGETAPLRLRELRGVAVLDDAGRRRYEGRFRW